MAKKGSIQYVCSNCGAVSSSWSGRCYNCGEWNTLQEQTLITESGRVKGNKLSVATVDTSLKKDLPRLKTGIQEVDNVLGGKSS